jgi:hypothetical protein
MYKPAKTKKNKEKQRNEPKYTMKGYFKNMEKMMKENIKQDIEENKINRGMTNTVVVNEVISEDPSHQLPETLRPSFQRSNAMHGFEMNEPSIFGPELAENRSRISLANYYRNTPYEGLQFGPTPATRKRKNRKNRKSRRSNRK